MVLDTNIVISAILTPQKSVSRIIDHLKNSRFTLITSEYLLNELDEVLDRPYFQNQFKLLPSKYSGLRNAIKQNALVIKKLTRPLIDIRDLKDLPVLATALQGNADYLVTGDKDLLVLAGHKSVKSLKIVTPTEFIRLIN